MDWNAIAIALPLFAVTNVDDLFVLLGFFADQRFRTGQVVAGQFLGIVSLIGVSLVVALLALALPSQWVGLLGLAPLAIGLKKLYDLGEADEDEDGEGATQAAASRAGNVAAVAAVTIANGGDNVGVYAPVFATRPAASTAMIVVTFLAMTAAWCAFSLWLVQHRTLGAPIRTYGRRALPFVLIALGVLILYEARSFELLSS